MMNHHLDQKTYVAPQMLKSKVDSELKVLLENNKIEKSNSQYSSPMVLVKKEDGNIRICCDYRRLIKVTQLDEIINTMGNGKIYTTLDLTRGFLADSYV